MDKTIRDIGRPRIRSSRPTPPGDFEEMWQDAGAEETAESERSKEEIRPPEGSRH